MKGLNKTDTEMLKSAGCDSNMNTTVNVPQQYLLERLHQQ